MSDDLDDTLYALPINPDVTPPRALVVNHLVVDELPRGKVSHVFVELVGDGLAIGIRTPVLVARGLEDGPVFGITAALHGNELNGIPVIHGLFEQLPLDQLRGTVVGVVAANVPSLHRNERSFIDGVDLNHIFPGNEHGTVSQVYAGRLLNRIVSQFDYLVDLHTASFGRVNSLYVRADMTRDDTAWMARLLQPQIIVHNPASDYTLRGCAMEQGIPAITLEIGDPQLFQEHFVTRSTRGLRRVLAHFGVLPAADGAPLGQLPAICRSSRWMYADRGGLLEVLPGITERVEQGQLVARLRNAFGEVFRHYEAPWPGIVIGHSVNPVGQTGARILHLGDLGEPEGMPALD